jgi:alcohol-forming fatty acyl-CoA reductase
LNDSANHAKVAAFFDVDGTLIPFPSLERRLLRALLYRRAIPAGNLAPWLAEALWLSHRGFAFARQANKMYLRGISVEKAAGIAQQLTAVSHLAFFPEAMDRVALHAAEGHRIVLVSGTLQLLARNVARLLETALARRGITATIFVRATRLEEAHGRWTGRVDGVPMFGRAKADAIDELRAGAGLDLRACFAYGDSMRDRQMLERLGHPVAVNASGALRRIAQGSGWRIVKWRLREEGKRV